MLKTAYRSHGNGELRIENTGQEVTLSGWVHRTRDKGALLFIDLRDRYGVTQLLIEKADSPELYEEARKLGREDVIQISGKVAERASKNPDIATGDIEVVINELTILNAAEVPPFTMEDETDGGEELRMQYRYLDLRRSVMAKRIEMRARTIKAVREYLDKQGFLEIETPNLIKSTPEGARDFLVPSRLQKGKFYALPQSPQILKQLLMVGGMDRYYQIVKCYRDEDFRGDRQPEFSQIDCEMAFVDQEDVLNTFEGMTKHVFKQVINYELPEMPRLTYADAMSMYGSDKPDLRFGCPINELNETFADTDFQVFRKVIDGGGLIAGLAAKGCADMTRKQLDKLIDFVKEPHRGAGGMVWVKWNEDGSVKSTIDKFFSAEKLQEIATSMGAEPGDLLLLVADKTSVVRKCLGDLRLELADQRGWIKEGDWSVLWVVDFPLFEKDEETGQTIFVHHPFCSPRPEDIQYMDSDPMRCRAYTYDMVINGNEIVSGSIRIHQHELQQKVFDLLGFSDEERDEQFGFLLNAFKYGAPPHGGCAFGLDRWVMLMSGGETIRDVIAFPKNNAGRDLMMDAPSAVDGHQLEELGVRVAMPESPE